MQGVTGAAARLTGTYWWIRRAVLDLPTPAVERHTAGASGPEGGIGGAEER